MNTFHRKPHPALHNSRNLVKYAGNTIVEFLISTHKIDALLIIGHHALHEADRFSIQVDKRNTAILA